MGQQQSHESLHMEVVSAFKNPRLHPLFACSSNLGGNGTFVCAAVGRGDRKRSVAQLSQVEPNDASKDYTQFPALLLSLPHLNPCVADGDLVAVKVISLAPFESGDDTAKYCLFATGSSNPAQKQGVSIQEYLNELEVLTPFVHDDRKPPPIDEILQGNIAAIPVLPRIQCQGQITKEFVESFLERLYECKLIVRADPTPSITQQPKAKETPSLHPLHSNDIGVVIGESVSTPHVRRGSHTLEQTVPSEEQTLTKESTRSRVNSSTTEPSATKTTAANTPPSTNPPETTTNPLVNMVIAPDNSAPTPTPPIPPPRVGPKKIRRWVKRHANLVSIRAIEERSHAYLVATEYHVFNMKNLLKFSKKSLIDSSVKASFLLYQLLHVLHFCHQRGVAHGNLRPDYILFTKDLWMQLSGFQCPLFPPYSVLHHRRSWGTSCFSIPPPMKGQNILESITERWYYGELSNFDYLLALNELSGHKFGDASYHPVFPWIMDFSSPMGGWRDFKKSKFRLNKGDEQLEVTYNSPNPHHITDLLTDVPYYIYVARRTPIPVLTRFVRSIYIPNEYPLSMKRMYEWTPNECIPEFFSCPDIFVSIHPDMPDLAIPEWASDNVDFIRKHRMALESEYVSQNLHWWIDLTFGYQLSGQHAIDAKNVILTDSSFPKNHGFVQLFKRPHIARKKNLPLNPLWGVVTQPTRKPPPPQEGFEWMRDALRHMTAVQKSGRSSSMPFALPSPSSVYPGRREFERPAPLGSSFGGMASPGFPPRNVPITATPNTITSESSSSSYINSLRSPSQSILEKARRAGVIQEMDRFSKRYLSSGASDFLRSADARFGIGALGNPLGGMSTVRYSDMILQESKLEYVLEPLRNAEIGRVPGLHKTDPVGCYALPKAEQEFYEYPPASITQLSASDMFSVGCILAEMHLDSPLFNAQSVRQYYYEGILPPELDQLPHYIRPVVMSLIAADPFARPSAKNILKSNFFPPYFMLVHKFLSKMHFTTEYAEKMQLIMAHNADLSNLPLEGFQLILPTLLSIFENGETLPYIPLIVFDMIGSKLGPVRAKQVLMQPIMRLFQVPDNSELLCSLIGGKFIYCAIKTFGLSTFLEQILPYILNALRSKDETVRRLASQNIINLSTNLGPVMSLTYIVQPLLQQLKSSGNLENVIHTLVCLGAWLGERNIVRYYLPTLFDLLQTHSVKSSRGEPVLIVVLTLIEKLSNIISPGVSLDVFVLNSNHIFRLLLNPSPKSGLLKSIASTLLIICRKIGSENTKKHVLPYLHQFFQNYNWIYQKSDEVSSKTAEQNEQYRTIYTLEVAHQLYSGFSDLLSPEILRKEIENSDLIESLLLEYQPRNQFPVEEATEKRNVDAFISNAPIQPAQSGFRFNFPKEDMDYPGNDEKDYDVLSFLSAKKMEDEETDAARKSGWMEDFDTIFRLSGHSSAVKFIDVRNDEQYFVSGSKDCTVKVWKNFRRTCLRTYTGHKNPIVCNRLLDNGAVVASCDHAIHIWDVETGAKLNNYEGGISVVGGNPINYTAFHLSPHQIGNILVAGTQESNIRIIDRRIPMSACEWRLHSGAGSAVRSLYIDMNETWMAVGHGTGHISMLDFRTGSVLSSFRAHDSQITHLHPLTPNYLLSSSNDRTMALWDITNSTPQSSDVLQEIPPATISVPPCLSVVKGHHDCIPQFVVHNLRTVSCAGGRVSYVNFTDLVNEWASETGPFETAEIKVTGRRLNNHNFVKSAISSMALMPYNRILLTGMEDGSVRLNSRTESGSL